MNDLLYVQGQDNLAGLVDKIYYCPIEDINTLPALTAASSLKTAATAITCKTGKKFQQIYFTDETAKVETKSIGPRDGKGRESTLTCRFPKIGKLSDGSLVADLISDIQNTPVVIIYKLASDGQFYLLGVSRLDKSNTTLAIALPCNFESADANSGEKRGDQNGVMFTWKFTSLHDPILYASTVPLTPAP